MSKLKLKRNHLWIAGVVVCAASLGGLFYVWKHVDANAPDAKPVEATPVATNAAPANLPLEAAKPAPAPVEQAPSTRPTMYFAFDDAHLNDETKAGLDDWAKRLRLEPGLKVQLEGNCDERGSDDYNMTLGQSRADAVRDYLVQAGVEAGRLNTVSYGKGRPAAQGHDEAAWSQNRRVDLNAVQALSER